MLQSLASLYGSLLRGLVVLAVAGAISQGRFVGTQETARKSLKHGLIKLQDLNRRVGIRAVP